MVKAWVYFLDRFAEVRVPEKLDVLGFADIMLTSFGRCVAVVGLSGSLFSAVTGLLLPSTSLSVGAAVSLLSSW